MPLRGQETKETGHSVGASETDGRDRSWSNGPRAHERAYGHPGAAVDPEPRPRRTAWLPTRPVRAAIGRGGRAAPARPVWVARAVYTRPRRPSRGGPPRSDPTRAPQGAAVKRTRP
jgi:hypothetical protein